MVVDGSGYGLITGGILVSAKKDCRKPYVSISSFVNINVF